MKSFVHWWLGEYLPKQYLSANNVYKNNSMFGKLEIITKHWFIHPVKRRIAKYYLVLLKRFFNLNVIAITGSAGKTTTKEMITSILKIDGNTVCSYANIDPVYNIPMSILKCRPSTKYLILEMGVEYPNEMDYYLWLAKPDVGVITNIYPTHTEFFGNIEGVYNEKSKLAHSLKKEGFAVLNKEDTYLVRLKQKLKAKEIWFGEGGQVQVRKTTTSSSYRSRFKLVIDRKNINIVLPTLGKNTIFNALAAASVGHVYGVSLTQIKKGLERYRQPAHRMVVHKLRSGAILLDDSYNSNPLAFQSTLEVFANTFPKRKKIVVFGDMLELGEKSARFHKMAGKDIIKNKIDILIGVGEFSRTTVRTVSTRSDKKAFWVKSYKSVKKILNKQISKHSAVLIKGSRSINLDKVANDLIAK